MQTYKLTFAYDGTAYGGWQVQPNAPSIQKTVQDQLKRLFRKPIDLTGAGRTDAGVHALGQTAHIKVEEPLDLFRFRHGLNALLPHDIRLMQVELKDDDFHARYSATGKIYSYHLALRGKENPLLRHCQWQIPYRDFSLEALRAGAERLLGTHDFKGFASENHQGVAARDSIRTLKRIEITSHEEVVLTFEADGFLYKMVRNLVGTLVDVGRGYFSPERINEVLLSGDRRLAGQAAPAHGLCLDAVIY
jgi:tRNA pseudouridine38-40 synthase